jgi:hypothetical protein
MRLAGLKPVISHSQNQDLHKILIALLDCVGSKYLCLCTLDSC